MGCLVGQPALQLLAFRDVASHDGDHEVALEVRNRRRYQRGDVRPIRPAQLHFAAHRPLLAQEFEDDHVLFGREQ